MINWIPNKQINKERVNELLQTSVETGLFTNNGPNVQLLEQVIREKLQIDDNKAVIVVTNGSVALHAIATSIEYYHKQKINWATQSFTFPPSAQGTLSNAKIVDIDKDGGLNLDELDKTIHGIIVTNIFGNVVDIEKYEKWAKEHNKFLLFDNAATPFTFYKGKSCCNYGHGSTISFHHTKPLGFGEGGAIIVDKKYEKNIRCLNNFGINLTEDFWVRKGNNNKMSDISAAYIIQYLDNFTTLVNIHKQLYTYFKEQITTLNLPLKLFPSFHDADNIMPSCFCLLFDNYNDNVRLTMLEKDIFCRKYYHPLNNTKNAINIYNKILCLPCTTEMKNSDINTIISIINHFYPYPTLNPKINKEFNKYPIFNPKIDNNKPILIIGNSPCVKKKKLGHLINLNNFNIIRFNFCEVIGYEEYVGTGTTFLVMNSKIFREQRSELPPEHILVTHRYVNRILPDNQPKINVKSVQLLPNYYKKYVKKGNQVTSGMAAIACFLEVYSQIYIYGFSFCATHYYNENKGSKHAYHLEKIAVSKLKGQKRVVFLNENNISEIIKKTEIKKTKIKKTEITVLCNKYKSISNLGIYFHFNSVDFEFINGNTYNFYVPKLNKNKEIKVWTNVNGCKKGTYRGRFVEHYKKGCFNVGDKLVLLS